MATDNTTGCLVPNHRLNIAELLKGAFQLFVFLVAGFEILTGVVFGGHQIHRAFLFDNHTSPHSANFSKPPTERMNSLAVSTIFS